MATPGTTNEDPRIAQTRQRAMDATLELAGASGLEACTFEAVSEQSGIARSTLYRHWNNKSELIVDALKSRTTERFIPDTGNLRDDMLAAMLGLEQALKNSTWGAMLPQVLAAASIDADMRDIQHQDSDYHLGIDTQIIERAIERGELDSNTNPSHAAMLFAAPVFYQHLFTHRLDAKWVTAHIDNTVALLLPN